MSKKNTTTSKGNKASKGEKAAAVKAGAARKQEPKKAKGPQIERQISETAGSPLGGRGERTIAIEQVMIANAKKGNAYVKPSAVAKLAEVKCKGIKAVPNHLRTLSIQNVLEKGPGGYRLSPMALKLIK